MHIAYLTPEYPHKLCPASGGLGTSIKNMAESLIEKNVQVSIIVYGQESDEQFQEDGLNFYFISQKKYPAGGWYFYRKYLEKQISRIIKKDKIDILEAPDWTGITAFMHFKVPVVIRMNGTDAYFCALENRKQKFKNRFFEKKALNNADRIVSVSDYTGKKTMEVLNIVRPYEVIPNSISINDFKPSEMRCEENRILYYGTIIRKKGVLALAEIFNEVVIQNKDARLILAGRDVVDIFEQVSTLQLFKRKLSKEAVNRFNYLGALNYLTVREEIAKAGVVVLPSFAEALPMTWLEAMAMEKPLVTSNIGWAPEVMINGETGFMVDPWDHQRYAKKILQLMKDQELAGNMGKAARKRVVKNFSTEVVSIKNLNFYEEVIDKKR